MCNSLVPSYLPSLFSLIFMLSPPSKKTSIHIFWIRWTASNLSWLLMLRSKNPLIYEPRTRIFLPLSLSLLSQGQRFIPIFLAYYCPNPSPSSQLMTRERILINQSIPWKHDFHQIKNRDKKFKNSKRFKNLQVSGEGQCWLDFWAILQKRRTRIQPTRNLGAPQSLTTSPLCCPFFGMCLNQLTKYPSFPSSPYIVI